MSSDNEHLKTPGRAWMDLREAKRGDDSPETLDAARYELGWRKTIGSEPAIRDEALEAAAQEIMNVINGTDPNDVGRMERIRAIRSRSAIKVHSGEPAKGAPVAPEVRRANTPPNPQVEPPLEPVQEPFLSDNRTDEQKKRDGVVDPNFKDGEKEFGSTSSPTPDDRTEQQRDGEPKPGFGFYSSNRPTERSAQRHRAKGTTTSRDDSR